MNRIHHIRSLLQQRVNESRKNNPLFFKMGPGGYAEHDRFLGVPNPAVRIIAKQFSDLLLDEIYDLLASSYNEERLLALFILVAQYKKADEAHKQKLYQFYMNNMKQVNNWNLVDSSAHLIVGAYLYECGNDKDVLVKLAQSDNLWERRVAIIATWYCIKKLDFTWTLAIAKILLHGKHDLIHKAVGWMLREVGQKDMQQLKTFLDEYAAVMPRTMLRYALEKLPQDERKFYMQK